MPRQRTTCSLCDERSPEKMAVFYWGWTWPSGDRRGYKQFFDFECSTGHLRRIVKSEKEEDKCIGCDRVFDPYEDPIELWLTYYLPGRDRADALLMYHEKCFVEAEGLFTQGAVRLPDRRSGGAGPGAPTRGNRWESWEAMGITPA